MPQWPGSSGATFGVDRAYRRAVLVAVGRDLLVARHHCFLRPADPELCAPILLGGVPGAHDPVAVASPAPRALLHLRRHACTHLVEEGPTGPHEPQLARELPVRDGFMIDARACERDSPEIGRPDAAVLLDHVDHRGRGELRAHPGQSGATATVSSSLSGRTP